MPCSQIFRGRKLAFVFRKSPSSLNEFIGYVELTDFRESWPDIALMTKEQKCVSEFFYFENFLVTASDASRFGNCSMLELDNSIKR